MNNDTTHRVTSNDTYYIETPVRPSGTLVKLDAILKRRMQMFMKLKFGGIQAVNEKE